MKSNIVIWNRINPESVKIMFYELFAWLCPNSRASIRKSGSLPLGFYLLYHWAISKIQKHVTSTNTKPHWVFVVGYFPLPVTEYVSLTLSQLWAHYRLIMLTNNEKSSQPNKINQYIWATKHINTIWFIFRLPTNWWTMRGRQITECGYQFTSRLHCSHCGNAEGEIKWFPCKRSYG